MNTDKHGSRSVTRLTNLTNHTGEKGMTAQAPGASVCRRINRRLWSIRIRGYFNGPIRLRSATLRLLTIPSANVMFFTLLIVTFVIALGVSALVARAFDTPIGQILSRIIGDEISAGWQKYVRFALYVVGISGGVSVWRLEQYISGDVPATMSSEQWVLEIYRVILDTLQSLAWVLLIFFVFALLAYVIVRLGELRRGSVSKPPDSV